ncbi:ABC transporter permease [Gracilibacillus timonensis]|uniref:ABC transporter permease n=1 Tax=Gracilibacillus timonensis TaxID=1816696 RepID=UPI000825D780|nr:ABC transporter permease [Gracilibacillus timonensis]
MKYLLPALRVELLKVRKSKVVWITTGAFTLAPLIAGFFMFVLRYPAFAERSGLLGAQAQIVGEASWPAYLNLLAQMIAVGGILIFGFVSSWLFGREYADGTIKDLLALPYPRAVMVAAKFIAAGLTCLLISLYIITLGLLLGWFVGLPQGSLDVFLQGLGVLLLVTVLVILLSTPVAFIACYSRGYLAPLGFVIIVLVFAQIIAAAGFGAYFPWAIPALYSGIVASSMALDWLGLMLIFITSIIGVGSTLAWWLMADQH